jgi:prepilin-type N-terminal cleavage/methylation domain-containing protein
MTPLLSRRNDRGFTLIELTVVLAVIVTLALVLTPSITNFINDARASRARADIGSLQAAITQFYKDNGFWPQWSMANNGGPGLVANKVDLLVSAGNTPTVASANTWTTGTNDRFEDQLIANAPGYTTRTATSQFGWSGPYISNVINADPWNNRYAANISAIDNTIGITDSSNNLKNAVWVLSAGANGILDTPYTQAMTVAVAGGDDLAVRLQ